MRFTGSLLIASIAVLVSGCGTPVFSERKANPVIKSKIGSLDLAANTSARRNVYIRTADTAAASERSNRLGMAGIVGGRKGEMCAEPPPEAIEALVATFAARAEVSGTSGKSFEAGLERGLSTSIASTFKRSQGIQFYRDAAFTICTAMLNGYIKPGEYTEQLWRARDAAKEVMLAEFRTNSWNSSPDVIVNMEAPVIHPLPGN